MKILFLFSFLDMLFKWAVMSQWFSSPGQSRNKGRWNVRSNLCHCRVSSFAAPETRRRRLRVWPIHAVTSHILTVSGVRPVATRSVSVSEWHEKVRTSVLYLRSSNLLHYIIFPWTSDLQYIQRSLKALIYFDSASFQLIYTWQH